MADLIAQGANPDHRWRRHLPEGRTVLLGRGQGVFAADWDEHISRRHAELYWDGRSLAVRKAVSARNPVFSAGREVDFVQLLPGEHFVLGQTIFTLVDEPVDVTLQSPQPTKQETFSPEFLQQFPFQDARARIEVLSRLPDVISAARNDEELFVRMTGLLMTGIPRADAVAVVRVIGQDGGTPIEVMHWDRRQLSHEGFRPSERLIREAAAGGSSVLHLWSEAADQAAFTAAENIDWAFCTPISGDACRGWAIYVAGQSRAASDDDAHDTPIDLRDDLKFTEVAAATLRSLHELRLLQQQHAGLSQFFSPLVLDALEAEGPEAALAPREAEVTVMFCDLRGFSRESEKAAGDLMGLLDRVSKALGVTTHHILTEGGVVGDFQGDAVMGFWGWPLRQQDAIARVCQAALAIRADLASAAQRAGDPLVGFALGVGIATGKAVAGKIGTVDQVKVTVFGPVVNLAARLESLTKTLRAPILLDAETGRHVRGRVDPAIARVRRLAVIRPFGLENPVEVYELLPPASQHTALTDDHLAEYEAALDAFQAGRWDEAFQRLHRVPAEDRAKDFLTVLIAQHNRSAPDGWNGVIELEGK